MTTAGSVKPISEIARGLGLPGDLVTPYGNDKAKVRLEAPAVVRRSAEPAQHAQRNGGVGSGRSSRGLDLYKLSR